MPDWSSHSAATTRWGAPEPRHNGRVDYHAYLRTPHWQNVRKRYWASGRPKQCALCLRNDLPLDLHHKTYERIGKERLSDLMPLCRPCHDGVHALKKKRKKRRRRKR